ncbi:hypothetical protein VTP01DRAFT_5084 [Rhizomucor pusillus]|uniref:uncharacterized protein n=1 Tax=Rhizomucor pusillus TaxID=4840 RepID=UPI0037444B03
MEASEPQFLIHQTSHVYVSETIYFQAIQMNKSLFVWVGKQQAKLNDLSVAMPAFGTQVTYTSSPAATAVMGLDVSEASRNLARRLAAKYGQQFFVSLDLGNQDEMLLAFAEKKLQAFIKSILS